MAIAPIPAGLVRWWGRPQCLIVTEAIENLLASRTFPNMEPDRRGILTWRGTVPDRHRMGKYPRGSTPPGESTI